MAFLFRPVGYLMRVGNEILQRLEHVLVGTVGLTNEMAAERLVDMASGSTAERETDEGRAGGWYRPIAAAYFMSEVQLSAAGSHLSAVSTLLERGSRTLYAVAALATSALESSARAAWLLDPDIDGRTRGVRGLGELFYALHQDSKMPIPAVREKATGWMTQLIEDAGSARPAPVRNRKGEVLHFGELRPAAAEVVRREAGTRGVIAYLQLAGLAQGDATAHARLMEQVPGGGQTSASRDPRIVLAGPASLTDLAPSLAVVWLTYTKAFGHKVMLYGWDRTRHLAWTSEAGSEIGLGPDVPL